MELVTKEKRGCNRGGKRPKFEKLKHGLNLDR